MANLRSEKLLAKKSSQRFTGATLLLARFGFWIAVGVGVLALLWGMQFLARNVFFSRNPHYTLQAVEVTIESGTLTPEEITRRLDLRTGEQNLYAVDLAATRRLLRQDPVIRQVELRRRVPDTLVVQIWGRTPVARMVDGQGTMIDADGFVLPPASEPAHRALPIITPFDPAAPYQVGDQVREPIVQEALRLLRTVEASPNGNWLEISRINLQPSENQLLVLLRGNAEHRIRENAVVIMDARDIDTSVERAITAIMEHAKTNGVIGRVDATLIKVPVSP